MTELLDIHQHGAGLRAPASQLGCAHRVRAGVRRIAGVRLADPAVLGHAGRYRHDHRRRRSSHLLDHRVGGRRSARRSATGSPTGSAITTTSRSRRCGRCRGPSEAARERPQVFHAMGRLGDRDRPLLGPVARQRADRRRASRRCRGSGSRSPIGARPSCGRSCCSRRARSPSSGGRNISSSRRRAGHGLDRPESAPTSVASVRPAGAPHDNHVCPTDGAASPLSADGGCPATAAAAAPLPADVRAQPALEPAAAGLRGADRRPRQRPRRHRLGHRPGPGRAGAAARQRRSFPSRRSRGACSPTRWATASSPRRARAGAGSGARRRRCSAPPIFPGWCRS